MSMQFNLQVEISAIYFKGCGHTCYIEKCVMDERKKDHKTYYCSICGQQNVFPKPEPKEEKPIDAMSTMAKIFDLMRPTKQEKQT